MAELGRKGTRAAIVLSAGVRQSPAEGAPSYEQAMLAAAKPYLLRVLGPNCLGLLVPSLGLNASFAPCNALTGKLAFVTQSGALAPAMLDWAAGRGIGLSARREVLAFEFGEVARDGRVGLPQGSELAVCQVRIERGDPEHGVRGLDVHRHAKNVGPLRRGAERGLGRRLLRALLGGLDRRCLAALAQLLKYPFALFSYAATPRLGR